MLFGSKLQQAYGPENVKFVMDSARYARHKNDIYTINDEPFAFALQDAAEVTASSDLVIVAVKGPDLAAVVDQIAPSVGPDTIIISFMNGITSENILAAKYTRRHILDCIAIGMDAMRDGRRRLNDILTTQGFLTRSETTSAARCGTNICSMSA